jgi:O-antigen/teichoic acid export membrane protein
VPSVSRTFSVLALGEAVARLVAFAATILIARRLGAAAFGIISVAAAVRLYLVCMVEGGIDSIGMREAAAQRSFARQLAPALVVVRVGVAALLVLLVATIGFVLLPQPDGVLIALYSLTLLPLAANLRWLHLGHGSSVGPALTRLASESLMLVVVVVALHEPGDLVRVPLAQFLGDATGAVLLALLVGKALGPLSIGSAWRTARPVLAESWPLVLHALLGLVMFNADLLMLRLFRGATEVGQYAAAYTIIGFLVYLGVVYYQSLLPALSRDHLDAAARARTYALSLEQVLLAGAPVAAGGILVAGSLIPFVFGAGYGAAALPFALLAASVPASWLRNVAQAGQVAQRRSELLLRTSLIAVGVNLALNLLLIPRFGPVGAAAATLATEVLRAFIALGYSRGLGYPLPGVRMSWRPLLGVLVMAAGLLGFRQLPVWVAIPAGAILYGAVALPGGGHRVLRGLAAPDSRSAS